jgi:histone-lysine N-methyltransferase SUV39H
MAEWNDSEITTAPDTPLPKKRRTYKKPFEVDEIKDMLIDENSEDFYLMSWMGYSDETWEPFCNLDRCPEKLDIFREKLRTESKFTEARDALQDKLSVFAAKINCLRISEPPITVVNEVDLTTPCNEFTYIRNATLPSDREQVSLSCDCKGGICGPRCPCAEYDDNVFAYKSDSGLLKTSRNVPIYECSAGCSCDFNTCPNRVVQRGRTVEFELFKTHDGRGWGMRTKEPIEKHQFVVEYVGEVITNKEAERRGIKYDARGRTYLFDMDLFVDDFTIDAKPFGNEARFINHACKPNLFTRCVWWDSLDISLHHVALFAKRDIKAGEELTFNYSNSSLSRETVSLTPTPHEDEEEDEGENTDPAAAAAARTKRGTFRCRCTAKCKKSLFK